MENIICTNEPRNVSMLSGFDKRDPGVEPIERNFSTLLKHLNNENHASVTEPNRTILFV